MSRGAALLASLLVTISRPAWWPPALAGFLVRGGFVAFVLPIVFVPSLLAVSSTVAPLVMSLAFGRIDGEVIAIIGGGVGLLLAWLLVGGWIAAAMDVLLIRGAAEAAEEEGIGRVRVGEATSLHRRRDRAIVSRVLAARLIAAIPLTVAVAVGVARIVAVAYIEMTRPLEVDTPLVGRVAMGAAPELALILAAWAIGEIVAGLAARRIVLERASVRRALAEGVRDAVRRPLATVVPWVVTTTAIGAMLALTLGAARVAWSRAVVALAEVPGDPIVMVAALLAFVTIWLAALVHRQPVHRRFEAPSRRSRKSDGCPRRRPIRRPSPRQSDQKHPGRSGHPRTTVRGTGQGRTKVAACSPRHSMVGFTREVIDGDEDARLPGMCDGPGARPAVLLCVRSARCIGCEWHPVVRSARPCCAARPPPRRWPRRGRNAARLRRAACPRAIC